MAGSYSGGTEPVDDAGRARLAAERDRIRAAYLNPRDERPPSSARGVHHVALICADVERTTRFYQEVLGFPLTTMFENRDLAGSTHFFFDLGVGNTIAFFDLPGVDPGDYAEVLGGLHHLAISVEPENWTRIKANLEAAGIEVVRIAGSELGSGRGGPRCMSCPIERDELS